MPKNRTLSTSLIHHPYAPPEGFESPAVGVFKASTVLFPSVAQMRSRQWVDKSSYTYGLHGTPTTFMLEQRLATLEGATHVTLVPSGLAAVTLPAMALLKLGDHMLLPSNVYGPNLAFVRHELAAWGVMHGIYDPMQPTDLRDKLQPNTRLVWLEAPGSITLEFPDLRSLVRTIREAAPQAVIAIDNTWGAGIAFSAFDLGEGLGADISAHALTKYPSGGGDVLMGSVSCRDVALHEKLALTHSRIGFNVGLNDVEAILRALPSIGLRYAAHDASTRAIARHCQAQPAVQRVLHPALEGSPGHAHWASHCTAAASLLTLEFKARFTPQQIDAFVDSLSLFRIGYSWGGPVSLAVPYNLASMRPTQSSYAGGLVRLNVGLEHVDDLMADLNQAFAVMA